MNKIKHIFRLIHFGRSIKFIEREFDVSRNTIRKYLALQRASGHSIVDLLEFEDSELNKIFYPVNGQGRKERYRLLADQYFYYKKELERTGVTRWLLWKEYRQSNPKGYSYSQFCWHLQQLAKPSQATMGNLPHQPGAQLYLDFAGKKMEYINPRTGEIHQTPIFVATLGMSQYSYVQAVASQKTEDFLRALTHALSFFGGVTKTIIPDNLKAAVIKSDRYEPTLNTFLEDFADHYKTTVLPARPARPKDKSLVETAVREVYRNIFAPLRNRQFFSITEINQAIIEQLHIWHKRPFQGRQQTRGERFVQIERPALQALPDEPFYIKKYRELIVRNNSHIKLTEDKHYYSIPHCYIGQKVQVIYTDQIVQIYLKGELIASHHRSRCPYEYTTLKQHLPSHHQHWLERSPRWYRTRAEHIGPEVVELINAIIAKKTYPEQAYSSCDGILALSRKMGKEKLRRAAEIALSLGEPTYSFVKRLIQNAAGDLEPYANDQESKLPEHCNIRGKTSFEKILNP